MSTVKNIEDRSIVVADHYYLIEPIKKEESIKNVYMPGNTDKPNELLTGMIVVKGSGEEVEPFFTEGKIAAYSRNQRDVQIEEILLEDKDGKKVYHLVHSSAIRLTLKD